MNRGLDSVIGAAAAEVPDHRLFDRGVVGVWVPVQESGGAHHLATLAEAALRHADRDPGFLYFPAHAVRRDSLHGGELFPPGIAHRDDARANGRAIEMHRAGAAEAEAAAVLRAGETEDVADRPKQGHIVRNIEFVQFSVQIEGDHGEGDAGCWRGGALIVSKRLPPRVPPTVKLAIEYSSKRFWRAGTIMVRR